MASNKTNTQRSRSGRAFLYLALIFAVVAAVLVFVAANHGGGNKEEAASPSAAKSTVVVASRDISARTELTGGMLTTKKVPADETLRGAFTDTEQVVGQVTRQDILEGEQVTASKVGPQTKAEREQGLSFVIPQGMRAFSIQVDETSAVGGLLLPGDLVDIIAVFEKQDFDVDKAVTILQNIEVLAVAQESQESIPAPTSEEAAQATATPESDGTAEEAASKGASLGTRPEDVEPNPKARTVTLAVTQEQAQLLALTQARGDLALALRAYGDSADVTLNETTLIPMGAHPEQR
jgi:Flp pilus assembly protein CpaB